DGDGDDGDGDDDGDDIIGWTGTKWNFSGTMSIVDTGDAREGGEGGASMTIEFPSSGGVKISGDGEIPYIINHSTVKFEETRTGMIITIRGSITDTDSEGSDTSSWVHTLTLKHKDAAQAKMDWSGQETYSGWYYILKDKHTYGGVAIFSGQFTGSIVK
ncbi:MAG: hypothetical protein J6T38_07065, partial [Bacteroidaceae bacterium]|nr:hypothetical protein [Bacteroidaceae bacterium]